MSFKQLVSINIKIIKNSIKFSSKIEKIRGIFIITVGTIFVIGSYLISHYVVMYISTLPVIGSLFLLRITALAVLISFTMLIFSSLIISLSTIYNSKDIEFLISMPISILEIFLTKFCSTFVQSSWMLMTILLPFILAFSISKNFYFSSFCIVIISILIMFLISVCCGIIISILLSYFFPTQKLKDIAVISIILLTTAVYTALRFVQPEKLLNPDKFDELVEYLDFMSKPVARGLPSWWVAEIIRGIMVTQPDIVVKNFVMLFILAVVLFLTVIFLAKNLYYSGIFSNKTSKKKTSRVKNFKAAILNIEKNLSFALIKKDIKLFIREPIQWTQVVIVVALIIVYIFSITKLPVEVMYVRTTIAFFNLGSVMFIITALVLRFVFVQPSLEYKTFWILKSAPIELYKIFFSKIKIFLPLVLFVGWVMTTLSNYVLGVSRIIYIFSFFVITISSIVITVAGYSIGILFPKPNYQNIGQIETSFGGLMFVILSLCYIVLTITSFAYPVRQYVLGISVPTSVKIFHLTDFLLINLLYFTSTVYYGYKKFLTDFG